MHTHIHIFGLTSYEGFTVLQAKAVDKEQANVNSYFVDVIKTDRSDKLLLLSLASNSNIQLLMGINYYKYFLSNLLKKVNR
jgi:hypothetical protein